MLSVQDAQEKVREKLCLLPREEWPLNTDLLGLLLAEDVASDLDMPPFDKAAMDGFAVRSVDCQAEPCELEIIEEVAAGQTPRKELQSGQATRIMTGAPLPQGADAVIMIEWCKPIDNDRVRIEACPRPEQNLVRRGREMRRGEIVLRQGALLRPQEIGLLASVGKASVSVRRRAKVAVLSTGDEIVPPSEVPGPGQIRNSNAAMLLAQVARAGAEPHFRGIARDRVDSLKPLISGGLSFDILVLSGGVSAGKLDLVPEVLADLGVEAVFHKIYMKPGKPLFFGLCETIGQRPSYVFGLPGNPVSSMVCFELFVRPAIHGLMGFPAETRMTKAILAVDFAYKTDRPTYYPAQLASSESGLEVRPLAWFGSSDLRGVATSNAFVVFPPGDHVHRAGVAYDVLLVE